MKSASPWSRSPGVFQVRGSDVASGSGRQPSFPMSCLCAVELTGLFPSQPSPGCGCCVQHFLPSHFSDNKLVYSNLNTSSLQMTFCFDDCMLANCQVCSLPYDCEGCNVALVQHLCLKNVIRLYLTFRESEFKIFISCKLQSSQLISTELFNIQYNNLCMNLYNKLHFLN